MVRELSNLLWGPFGAWIGFSVLIGFLILVNIKWKGQEGTSHTAKHRLLADITETSRPARGDMGKGARKAIQQEEVIPSLKKEQKIASILPPTDKILQKQLKEAPTQTVGPNLSEERTEARPSPKSMPSTRLLNFKLSGPEESPAPFREETSPESTIDEINTPKSAKEPENNYNPEPLKKTILPKSNDIRCLPGAIDLIKRFEGFASRPYRCPGNIYTIGYGSTIGVDGRHVSSNHPKIDSAMAEKLLIRDLSKVEQSLLRAVKVPTNNDQWGALCSFVFNIGPGQFGASTLLRKLNRKDYQGAANQFTRWIYAGQTRLGGLYTRRKLERALFLGILN